MCRNEGIMCAELRLRDTVPGGFRDLAGPAQRCQSVTAEAAWRRPESAHWHNIVLITAV